MDKREKVIEELNELLQAGDGVEYTADKILALFNVVGRSEQLLAVAKYVYWNYDESSSKKPEDYLKDFLSQ